MGQPASGEVWTRTQISWLPVPESSTAGCFDLPKLLSNNVPTGREDRRRAAPPWPLLQRPARQPAAGQEEFKRLACAHAWGMSWEVVPKPSVSDSSSPRLQECQRRAPLIPPVLSPRLSFVKLKILLCSFPFSFEYTKSTGRGNFWGNFGEPHNTTLPVSLTLYSVSIICILLLFVPFFPPYDHLLFIHLLF